MPICMQSSGKMALLLILFLIYIIIYSLQHFVTILTYTLAFIMYWHMKHIVKQGCFNFDLNVTLIFTTCPQLHTVSKSLSLDSSN